MTDQGPLKDRYPGGVRPTTLLTALCASLASCATPTAQHPPQLLLPARSVSATPGSALLPQLQGLSTAAREERLGHEFASGNVPTFLRQLVPVTTTAQIQGRTRVATFWCTPDYLGVGSDQDWFRMPMTPHLARKFADSVDAVLPTRRMVNAIWAASRLKLPPVPLSPSSYAIEDVAVFYLHHQRVEAQRQGRPLGELTAGTKKDVVDSALIASWPGRVCIYGWHQTNGSPIQPLSKVHTSTYVDYSHGIRLVDRTVEVDGVPMSIDAVLADPVLHPLLSDEGPIGAADYAPATDESFPWHDTFPATGPQHAAWRPKFVTPIPVATVPPPPSGDPTALRILDPSGGTDSLRIEPGRVRDVAVQADLLCDHRPQLAADGFERIGVFVRDRAQGAFDGTLSQQGACYALTWDSDTGRVRCLRAAQGQLVDLLPQPRIVPGTTWRRFRVEARGDRLRFLLDGELLLDVQDATHPDGAFGIGVHEYFRTNSNARGARVDTFHADVPESLGLGLRRGTQRGGLEVRRRRAIPGDLYLTALTVTPGAFPNGWFHGLDPSLADLGTQLLSAHPLFLGTIDTAGRADLSVPGLPAGLPLQGVALTLDPSLRIVSASAPTSVTLR
jgi:hypothetical protein